MKWLFVLALGVASSELVISNQIDDEANEKLCQEELDKDPEFSSMSSENKFECLVSCMSRKDGITNKDGDYSIDGIESYLNITISDNQEEAIKKCQEQHSDSSNGCKPSLDTANCVSNVLFPQ